MIGELGELAELFQWKKDVHDDNDVEDSEEGMVYRNKLKGLQSDGWAETEIDKVQQEIADVAIYCLRLADVIGMKDLKNVMM